MEMRAFRAFTSGLFLAVLMSAPAHAEMVSATKPPTKTESNKPKHDKKDHANAHVDKKKAKHAVATDKKGLHGDKSKVDKDKNAHHVAAKGDHDAKKKHLDKSKAKPKHDAADKRQASRDKPKDHHAVH
jgi:hypothetical protein